MPRRILAILASVPFVATCAAGSPQERTSRDLTAAAQEAQLAAFLIDGTGIASR